MQIHTITTASEFSDFCTHLLGQSWIAVDTEFTRENSYFPQLCLLQVATDRYIGLIDPFSVTDLNALRPVLESITITKVFHAAAQDLEILYQSFGTATQQVFDTQLAATLLGLGNQIGYARLVQELLGTRLHKTQTRTDWSRRPLSKAQLEYAADDVRFLYQLYPVIVDALADKGRSDWLKSDLARLSDPDHFTPDPDQLWRKIKGHQRLPGSSLAVLQKLAVWRDQAARRANKPRKHIIRDDLLIEIARRKPRSSEALRSMALVPNHLAKQQLGEIVDAVDTALALSPEQWPSIPKYRELTKQQELLVDALMTVMKWAADRHDISTDIVGTRKDLQKMLADDTSAGLWHGWRYEYIGRHIKRFYDGNAQLVNRDGKIELEPLHEPGQ